MSAAGVASKGMQTAGGGSGFSILSVIGSAGGIEKTIILILFAISVLSWTIAIGKYTKFKQIRYSMRRFERLFSSAQSLEELLERVKSHTDNPLAVLFVAAMEEFRTKVTYGRAGLDSARIGHKERIVQALNLTRNRIMERLESRLGVLASVGSSAVFIGLLGTVFGIIHSFQSIAVSKNTSLSVVAPGIAEALIVTAIGLIVAIPASLFFNYFGSEIDSIGHQIDNFSGELNRLLARKLDER